MKMDARARRSVSSSGRLAIRLSLDRAFNEWHILAITQAICLCRQRQKVGGPLFLGIDTHALSRLALARALEVPAANSVDVMLAEKDDYTPTPVVSHAILGYNRDRKAGLSDGIVVNPRVRSMSRIGSPVGRFSADHHRPVLGDPQGWRFRELLTGP